MHSIQGDTECPCLSSASAGLCVSLGSSTTWFVPAIENEMFVMLCSSQHFSCMCCGSSQPQMLTECFDSRHVVSLDFSLTCWFCLCLSVPSWPFKLCQPVFSHLSFSFSLSPPTMQILFSCSSCWTAFVQAWSYLEKYLTREMWNFW